MEVFVRETDNQAIQTRDLFVSWKVPSDMSAVNIMNLTYKGRSVKLRRLVGKLSNMENVLAACVVMHASTKTYTLSKQYSKLEIYWP